MRCLVDNKFLAGWHWNLAFKVTANLVQSNFNTFLSDCRNVSIFSGMANCEEMKDLTKL